jgi:hypothetical protein
VLRARKGKKRRVTVHESLVASGADDREALAAESLIARLVPIGRPVVLTVDVLEAARAGNAALVALLLAEEIPAEPDDVELVNESRLTSASDRIPSEELRDRLGLR